MAQSIKNVTILTRIYPVFVIFLWAVGKHGLDSGLDFGLHFGLDFGLESRFRPTGYIFSFGREGGWGWERGIVLYRLYSSLLLVVFVLCLSFLVWVGGLDWSLCLTHGRHVSLES